MTPLQATVNIFVVMFMFLMLISMILLMFFIGKVRVLGIVVATAVLCLGNVLAYMEVWVKWLFPTSHAIMEIHFDELYREPILDMSWSYIYYVLAIFVLFVITLLSIDRYDFSKIQELED